jgi:hypothetical protein
MWTLRLAFAASLALIGCGGGKDVCPCAVASPPAAPVARDSTSPSPAVATTPASGVADEQPSAAPDPPAAPVPTDAPIAASRTDYGVEKIKSLALAHRIEEGNFVLAVVPRTPQIDVALVYPSWEEKRYSAAERIAKSKEIARLHDNKLMAVVYVVFSGDIMSQGETSKQIPDDFAEYVFLENDRGDAVRCTSATLPLFRSAGAMSREVKVDVEFADLKAPSGRSVLEGAKELRFVVGGLGFKSKTIRYAAPLRGLFGDAPRELRELFAGVETGSAPR